jgi:hypothetical protein
VMTTIRELGERGIVLRSLREGIDTAKRHRSDGGRRSCQPRRACVGARAGTSVSGS